MPEYALLSSTADGHQTTSSQVYVLRLWQEQGAGPGESWRASLLNPVSRRRRYFSSAATLTAYLTALDPAWPPDDDLLERSR